jgi:CBS domain-containing protein
MRVVFPRSPEQLIGRFGQSSGRIGIVGISAVAESAHSLHVQRGPSRSVRASVPERGRCPGLDLAAPSPMTQQQQDASRLPPQLLAADCTPIGDIMTRTPITVHPELALEDLIALLLEKNISRVPVVDENNTLIGIVSKTDLVVDQYMRGDAVVDQRGAGGPGFHVHGGDNIVRDVMTPVVFFLPAATTIGVAVRRMLADNIHTVPVTSDTGRIIGILSQTDVLAWVAGRPQHRTPIGIDGSIS